MGWTSKKIISQKDLWGIMLFDTAAANDWNYTWDLFKKYNTSVKFNNRWHFGLLPQSDHALNQNVLRRTGSSCVAVEHTTLSNGCESARFQQMVLASLSIFSVLCPHLGHWRRSNTTDFPENGPELAQLNVKLALCVRNGFELIISVILINSQNIFINILSWAFCYRVFLCL